MFCYARYYFKKYGKFSRSSKYLTLPENTGFYTFTFCDRFLWLCKSIPYTCGMVNVNANVGRVDTILLKEFENCLPIRMR